MTDNEQGDALTPGAIAAMRELGWSEAQIQAERQNAERIRAAGGFGQFVRKAEVARQMSEATGVPVEPEHINRTECSAAELLEQARDCNAASPPAWWCYLLALEQAQRNGWGEDLRAHAEVQFMRTMKAQADALPLLQYPSLEPWPKGEPLPPRWREGLFVRKDALRAWAKEYAPHWLGSALLSEPKTAPAEQPASVAGPGTASPEWQTIAREIADAFWNKHKEMGLQGTLDSYADKVESELRKRKITGPRGEWLSAGTVKREALQGARWWQKRKL